MKRWFFLMMMLARLALLTACAGVFASRPEADGRIEVVMTEYAFEPKTIRVKADQTIEFVLRNEGKKMHEFMIGRDLNVEGNLTEGFAVDFFEGIDLHITGPGMVMGMPGGMDMGGDEHAADTGTMEMRSDDHADADAAGMDMEMGGEEHVTADAEDMDMDMDMSAGDDTAAMDMGGDEHDADEAAASMDEMGAGDEHADDEHAEEVAGEFGAFQMPEMDAHSGVMIMIDPTMIPASEQTIVRLTVPANKVGTWEFGCFQERGQHYDDGMQGTLIVEP